MNEITVFQFIQLPSDPESNPITISIHRTRKGAESALLHFKLEKQKEYNKCFDEVDGISFVDYAGEFKVGEIVLEN